MTGFLVFGIVLTVFLVAGGAFLWWRLDRGSSGGSGKRRHREEARQLQAWLDADPDFVHNFHHPTQNEVLETLQALDFLTPDWDEDSLVLTEGRLKNELAESFPALRRETCVYPRPIASDVARRFDKAQLSPEALEDSLRAYAELQAKRRAGFHASRARENARHQMSAGPAIGPMTLTPGSLPFRVREEKRVRRFTWAGPVAAVAALTAAGAGAYLYVQAHPEARRWWEGNKPAVAAADPTPVPTPAISTPAQPTPAEDAVALAATPAPAPVDQSMEVTPSPAETPPPPGTPPPAVPPTASDAQAIFARKVSESQLRAIDKHPDLAVPNSEINTRFVFRYKNLVQDQSPRLQDPNWPEKLADECAQSTAPGGRGKRSTPARR